MGKKEEIGLRIRTMRKSRGMTQSDLARAIGQSASSVAMYEQGNREPNFETLEALADIFNVPISAIVEGETYGRHQEDDRPKTLEAKILARGIDQMPKKQREQALAVFRAVFAQYADIIDEKGNDDDDA